MANQLEQKLKKILIFALAFLSTLQIVFGQCTVNGEEVPCDDVVPFFLGVTAVFGILFLVCAVFWIWMLIDCLKREFNDKVLWILILLLTGILGAILYYFLVKRKGTESQKEKKTSNQKKK